jgi:hypothetical protein
MGLFGCGLGHYAVLSEGALLLAGQACPGKLIPDGKAPETARFEGQAALQLDGRPL